MILGDFGWFLTVFDDFLWFFVFFEILGPLFWQYYKKLIAEEVLTALTNEYDYLISEEAVIETIEANEYYFNIDGININGININDIIWENVINVPSSLKNKKVQSSFVLDVKNTN